MNLKSKLGALVVAAAALTLAAPLSASAATIQTYYGFASQASCKAEQSKPAYNNSFVRVSKACYYKSAVYNWAFETTSIA